MFERSRIAAAKIGIHRIAFSPGAPLRDCTVLKVRGRFVYVSVDGLRVRLNGTASQKLIDGGYR